MQVFGRRLLIRPSFSDCSRGVAVAHNFRVKIGEIGLLTFIYRTAFQNGLEYRNSDFKRFNDNDLSTLRKKLVNFGPVIAEFKRLEAYTPS